jgi:hypothetical protein
VNPGVHLVSVAALLVPFAPGDAQRNTGQTRRLTIEVTVSL